MENIIVKNQIASRFAFALASKFNLKEYYRYKKMFLDKYELTNNFYMVEKK